MELHTLESLSGECDFFDLVAIMFYISPIFKFEYALHIKFISNVRHATMYLQPRERQKQSLHIYFFSCQSRQ